MESQQVTTNFLKQEINFSFQAFEQELNIIKESTCIELHQSLIRKCFCKMENEEDLIKVVDFYSKKISLITNVTDQKGRNLLMLCVKKNFLRLLKQLITLGIDLQEKDFKNQSLIFHLASRSRNQNLEIENFVLLQFKNIEKNSKNKTVLEKALENKKFDLGKVLAKKFYIEFEQKKIKTFTWIKKIMSLEESVKKEYEQVFEVKQWDSLLFLNEIYQQKSDKNKIEQKLSIKDRMRKKIEQKNKKYSCQLEGDQISEFQQRIRKFSEQPELKNNLIENSKVALKEEIYKMKKKIEKLQKQNDQQKTQKSNYCSLNSNNQNHNQEITNALDQEIRKYTQEVNQFQNYSKNLNFQIFDYISEQLRNQFDFDFDLQIQLSGSIQTRLNNINSNINMNVTYHYNEFNKRVQNQFINNIEEFSDILSKNPNFKQVNLEQKKFLSIINLQLGEIFKNKRVEIIFIYFQNESSQKDNLVLNYLQDFPQLRPIYLVTKRMLDQHGLTNPSQGGLKSICLIYMIIAFLKKFKNQKNLKVCSIGEIFLNFLYFYSYQFNHRTHYIRVMRENDESFYWKTQHHNQKELIIIDHKKHNIILTKIFKNSNVLKQMFKQAYYSFYKLCICKTIPNIQTHQILSVNEEKEDQQFQDDNTTIQDNGVDRFRQIVIKYVRNSRIDCDKELMEQISDEIQKNPFQIKETMSSIFEDAKSEQEQKVSKGNIFLLNTLYNLYVVNQLRQKN